MDHEDAPPPCFFSHAVIEKSQNNSDDRWQGAKLKGRARTWDDQAPSAPPPLSHLQNMVEWNS